MYMAQKTIASMLHELEEVTCISCDSKSAIAIAHNPFMHGKTKHIDVYYHYVQYMIDTGQIDTMYMPINKNVVDLFTKPLPRKT